MSYDFCAQFLGIFCCPKNFLRKNHHSDGEKSEPESEPSSRSEGNHISALALIILNFYNNDPKIAMDSIKKGEKQLLHLNIHASTSVRLSTVWQSVFISTVASELSSLIHADPVTSDSTPNIQQGEVNSFVEFVKISMTLRCS